MTAHRVLVVENDPFTLTTIVSSLQFQRIMVVGQALTARDALALQPTIDAEVALIDLDLGVGPTGIDLAHALRDHQPEIGIVILSTFRDPRLLAPGMPIPPRGAAYLSKGDINDFTVVASQVVQAARDPLKPRATPANELPQLTEAQVEVLRLVADGQSTQAIAEARNVSTRAITSARVDGFRPFRSPTVT